MKVKELSKAQNIAEEHRNLIIENGMNTLVDKELRAYYFKGFIIVSMQSGVELKFPVADNPHLAKGAEEELNNIEISPLACIDQI